MYVAEKNSVDHSQLNNASGDSSNFNENNDISKENRKENGTLTSNGAFDFRDTERHQSNYENFVERMKREKEEKRLAEIQEKKYDLEQLIKYDPWGKPGGGAPRMDDNRKKKFTEMDLKLDVKHHGNLEGLKLYRPGAGAPLVSESGDLKTQISGDPILRHNNQRVKAHTHRYCLPKEDAQEFLAELREAELIKAQREENERIWKLRSEQDLWDYHPYGKPGAGAPNDPLPPSVRSSSDQDNTSAPWGLGAGPPKPDMLGNFHRQTGHIVQNGQMIHPKDYINSQWDKLEGNELTLPVGLARGNGAPRFTDDGKPLTRIKNSLDMKEGKRNIDDLCEDNMNSPGRSHPGFLGFGSPGGGAPITDHNGQPMYGFRDEIYKPEDLERKKEFKQSNLRQTEKDLIMRELFRRKEEQEHLRGPINYSITTQMMNSHIGKPRRDVENQLLSYQPRLRTDVGETMRISPRRTEETPTYKADLLSQIQDREKMTEMIRKLNKDESNYHYEESPRVYGRPGGGAPVHPINHRKGKLLNLLENNSTSPNPKYDLNVRIPISDGYSSHHNRYEFESRNNENKIVSLTPPYGTTSGRGAYSWQS